MAVIWTFLTIMSVQILIPVARSSGKKGVVHTVNDYMCGDFNVLNVAWWYDYSMTLENFRKETSWCRPSIDNYKDTYVPMVWGLDWKIQLPNDGDYVLAFNEPNHGGQANISAEQAAAAWPELEKKSKGKLLVSPSAAICGGDTCLGKPDEWFAKFFKLCKGCRVDYLATHTFMCNANKVMKYLKDLHTKFGKQIWLTEFACGEVDDPEVMRLFMAQLLPQLEAADFVFRYAWYKARIRESHYVTTAASLLEVDSSNLTPLGRLYIGYEGGDIPIEEFETTLADEMDIILKNIIGVGKAEALIIAQAYTENPAKWWRIFYSIGQNLQYLPSSAAAFYISAPKTEVKQRIKTTLKNILCTTPDAIQDPDIIEEAERIKGLHKDKKQKGTLRRPAC
ncbi:uncharacterized protein LOC123535313 [Mercenaria mercenaria]|uniref:uncharacterized protein LOC123535313 n=1 Tax=Mercenaria mercenaria TaxID=6596 RepID=UPI00234F8709|nr:uncharacterized protein LOC123535313 [Mercenaria mercenaria]